VSNHPLSELVDRIASERHVWVRAALVKQDESWALALLEITLGAPPPGWRRAQWRYPRAVFAAISPKGATDARWLSSGRLVLRGASVPLTPGEWASREWRESAAATVYEQLDWPGLVWAIRPFAPTSIGLHEELVAMDAPAFLSFDEAALAFVCVPRLPNHRFNTPKIVVRQQLLAARIGSVTIRPSEIVAAVSGSGLRGTRLTVGGAHGGSKRLSSAKRNVRLPIASAPGPGAWVALHRGDVLLDRRVLDPAWRQAGVQVEVDLVTQVQILVSRGEGPTVEFKRQLPAADAQGPMKTISAFANGDGGVIIFGVDDDGQVVGIEQADLPRAVDRLATLISDWTRPPVDCSPQIVALGGDASVVIVSVPPGAEPPYAVGTDDRKLVYYVRRGATSAPARPSDVRAAVRARIPMTTQAL
jgi:hypothetical protein